MRKTSLIKGALLLFFLLFSSPAFSTEAGPSVGTFTCSYCPLTGPGIDSDTVEFIKTEVNPTVESWLTPNFQAKSVTICNGTHCAIYQYLTNGNWTQVSISPITSGGGGGGGSGGAGGGLGGGYYVYEPIYTYTTVCVGGYCESAWVLTGFNRIFIRTNNEQQ